MPAIDRLAPLVAKLGAPFAEQRAHHHGDAAFSFLYEGSAPTRRRASASSSASPPSVAWRRRRRGAGGGVAKAAAAVAGAAAVPGGFRFEPRAAADADGERSGWRELDPRTGRPYYVNKAKGSRHG